MAWEAAPTGKRGRQLDYSDAAIQTCLTMKVLFGMALRQTTGFVESLLRLINLDWMVPNFSTLSRRQKTLAVNVPYRGSKGPLHLLIDIEPVSATGSSEPARGIKVPSRPHPADAPAGQRKGKASGTPASMAASNGAFGARSTLALMSKHWKSEQSRSRGATPGMRRCYLICSTRFRAISTSAA